MKLIEKKFGYVIFFYNIFYNIFFYKKNVKRFIKKNAYFSPEREALFIFTNAMIFIIHYKDNNSNKRKEEGKINRTKIN